MPSEKPLFQPWNEEEFQADVFVRGMTWLQRHLYRTLLQAAFYHSTRPYLPNDDEVLWVLAGAESQEMWEQNKSKILKRFTPLEDQPELLEHKRVTSDWFNWQDIKTEAQMAGREGGKKSADRRRELYGTAKPLRVLVPNGPEGGSEASQKNHEGYEAREEKVREGKVREEKNTATGASLSQGPSKPADWKALALRHRAAFKKKAAVAFRDQYLAACDKYGEDVVLQCFDEWAANNKDWMIEKGFKEPLRLFFKILPEEAVDTMELNTAEQEQKAEATEKQQRETTAIENGIQQQIEEHQRELRKPSNVNEVNPEDFFKE
jgi:hypothetical protein